MWKSIPTEAHIFNGHLLNEIWRHVLSKEKKSTHIYTHTHQYVRRQLNPMLGNDFIVPWNEKKMPYIIKIIGWHRQSTKLFNYNVWMLLPLWKSQEIWNDGDFKI